MKKFLILVLLVLLPSFAQAQTITLISPTATANSVWGAVTATTPSFLSVPSCSGASNALTYTLGTGFGCNTIAGVSFPLSGSSDSATAPDYSWAAASNTGLYYNSGIGFTVGGTRVGAWGASGLSVTSNAATAFTVGPNGSSNPTLKIDGSTASSVSGVSIVGGATGTGATISTITSDTAGAGLNLSVIPKAATANGSGGVLTLNGGNGFGSGGSGGGVTIAGGTSATAGQTGGGVTISAGAPNSYGSGSGVTITASSATGSGLNTGGSVTLTAGNSGSYGNAGGISLTAGTGVTSYNGGNITLTAGAAGGGTAGTISLVGGLQHERTTVADAAYTVKTSDYLIAFTTLTATRAVTISCSMGTSAQPQFFIVKDEAGSAGTNNITFTGTVDGSTTNKISTNYGAFRYYSNGTVCGTW